MHRTDVVPELAGRRSMSLVARSKKFKLSSPRESHAHLPSDRLINQSPSVLCSVVGAVPRFPNWQTGRPVPEHTVLGGRCSPQIFKLADWATSPQAYSAQWSVQSPDLQAGRLGDQSPSIHFSVIGAVPRSSSWRTRRPVPEHTVLGGRCSLQERLTHHQFLSVILKSVSSHKWVM